MSVDIQAAALENRVVASPSTACLIQAYEVAKVAAEHANAEAERAKRALHEAFDAEGAAKFIDSDGRVLISRSTVQNTRLDRDLLARLAPVALRRATVVTPGYRVSLPRLK